jgi:hypothetical protein
VHEIDFRIRPYDIHIKMDVFPASIESDIKENSSEERKSISICIFNTISTSAESTNLKVKSIEIVKSFLFRGHEPIYFTENKEKTLRVSYDRDTHTIEYMN